MNRFSVRWAVLTLVAGLALAIAALAAADMNYMDVPVVVSCNSTGQTCDRTFQQEVFTTSQLELEFRRDTTSCASFSVDFQVDGRQVFTSAVLGPGQTTGTIVAGPVAEGTHLVEVSATGVLGGCDTGTLPGWGGRLGITTSSGSAAPAPPPGPTSVVECMNGGWRTFSAPGFKNQGDCVSFVATGGRNQPSPRP